MRDSTSESHDTYKAGMAELLKRRNPSVSMAQLNADIEALSKSCMLAFKKKMHVKDAIDAATEKLRFFIELEATKALAEYTGTVTTENEDAQDNDQPSAASVNSDVTTKGEEAAAAGCEVSIDSEGEGVQ